MSKCLQCDVYFEGSRKQLFCSDECQEKYGNADIKVTEPEKPPPIEKPKEVTKPEKVKKEQASDETSPPVAMSKTDKLKWFREQNFKK